MRQVLSFQLDNCGVNPVLYYNEPALCCDDDDVSVFILIHIDANDVLTLCNFPKAAEAVTEVTSNHLESWI
jgi:hypothetical protein